MHYDFCKNCPNPEPIPAHADRCPACEHHVSPPNVRAASQPQESAALQARYEDALAVSQTAGALDNLNAFGSAIKDAKIILSRSIAEVENLLLENTSYVNFYRQVASGGRIPADNKFDTARLIADSIIFPYYKENIVFAGLSLTDYGIKHYGPCGITLKRQMVEHRSSLFEGNTTVFCMKHKLSAGTKVPLGYRAVWSDLVKLACAKLHSYITAGTTEKDFPKILQHDDRDPAKDEFIEVHIYGSFNRSAIETISIQKLRNAEDQYLAKKLLKRAAKLGIRTEYDKSHAMKAAA